jgi:hypothetical protein
VTTITSPYAATDCHNFAAGYGCECGSGNADTERIAVAVAEHVVPAVVAFLADRNGTTVEDMRSRVFFAAPGHEYPNTFSLAFEGDYDWPFDLPQSVRTLARKHGVHIEVGAGWRLDLHPAS